MNVKPKSQNEQPTMDKRPLKIIADIPLWDLLVQGTKKTNKLSRVQALRDIIERQYITLLKGEDEYLSGSVLDFAKSWGWDRETVTRFLNELEQLGVITIDVSVNRKKIKLNCITDA